MQVAWYAKEVESIFKQVEAGAVEPASSIANNSLLDSLNGLIGTCQQQEKQFYNMIGCSGIEEFNNRKSQVGEYYFLNYTLNELLRAIGEKEVLLEDKIMNKFFDLIEEGINNDPESQEALAQTGEGVVWSVLKNYLSKNSNLKFFAYEQHRKGFVATKKVGLAKLVLRTKKDKDTNKITIIRLKEGEMGVVSDRYLKRVEQYLNKENQTDTSKANLDLANFQESVRSYVQKAIVQYGDNTDLVNYVRIKNLVNVNRSKANLIGFIGEIRAGLQFMKLFGPNAITMVGSIIKNGSGQQVPIDMLVQQGAERFGFQVKNYRPVNGQVQFSNSLSAAEFVDGRLQATGKLRELLMGFFGTYQFNQPYNIHTKDGKIRYNAESVIRYTQDIYNNYEGVFENLEKVFDARIGQILKITDNFSAQGENNPFTKQRNYYNTFFIIGNRIKPSSEILIQIRNALLKKLQGIGVDSFTHYTLSAPTEEPRRQKVKKGTSLSLSYLAEFPKISYDITIVI